MNIVLDTNCLIMALSPRSPYTLIWQRLVESSYSLFVSTSILEEYEEVISRNISPKVTKIVLSYLTMLPNVKYQDPHFSFGLIHADPDDNKFVDCAIAANALCIVTEDHHFDVLQRIEFPKVEVIKIDQFLQLLQQI